MTSDLTFCDWNQMASKIRDPLILDRLQSIIRVFECNQHFIENWDSTSIARYLSELAHVTIIQTPKPDFKLGYPLNNQNWNVLLDRISGTSSPFIKTHIRAIIMVFESNQDFIGRWRENAINRDIDENILNYLAQLARITIMQTPERSYALSMPFPTRVESTSRVNRDAIHLCVKCKGAYIVGPFGMVSPICMDCQDHSTTNSSQVFPRSQMIRKTCVICNKNTIDVSNETSIQICDNCQTQLVKNFMSTKEILKCHFCGCNYRGVLRGPGVKYICPFCESGNNRAAISNYQTGSSIPSTTASPSTSFSSVSSTPSDSSTTSTVTNQDDAKSETVIPDTSPSVQSGAAIHNESKSEYVSIRCPDGKPGCKVNHMVKRSEMDKRKPKIRNLSEIDLDDEMHISTSPSDSTSTSTISTIPLFETLTTESRFSEKIEIPSQPRSSMISYECDRCGKMFMNEDSGPVPEGMVRIVLCQTCITSLVPGPERLSSALISSQSSSKYDSQKIDVNTDDIPDLENDDSEISE